MKAVKIPRTIGESRAGTFVRRHPDGSFFDEGVQFYTDVPPLEERRKMTDDEKRVADGIVLTMATMFNKHAERLKALDRGEATS